MRGSNIILQQIPDLWVHTKVRQAKHRTNKNTPESLQLNKLCASTCKLALHEVMKARCFVRGLSEARWPGARVFNSSVKQHFMHLYSCYCNCEAHHV